MAERLLGSRRVFSGKLFSVRVDELELASGRRAKREIVEHPGAVGILAWDGERLALVRQWRQPAGAELLEIPAGTLEAGETPQTTAERELAEEVGVRAAEWRIGPRFFTAPGFCTEELTIFLATDLTPLAHEDRGAANDEDLALSWMSLDDAVRSIDEGLIADAKSLAGIGWLARELMGPPR
jgi:ADP-ribose pyrophosphatase